MALTANEDGNIFKKLRKSAKLDKTRKLDKKTLISIFAYVLTAIAKN